MAKELEAVEKAEKIQEEKKVQVLESEFRSDYGQPSSGPAVEELLPCAVTKAAQQLNPAGTSSSTCASPPMAPFQAAWLLSLS